MLRVWIESDALWRGSSDPREDEPTPRNLGAVYLPVYVQPTLICAL